MNDLESQNASRVNNLELNRFQIIFIDGTVVLFNLILILTFALYQTVPGAHSFISGKSL